MYSLKKKTKIKAENTSPVPSLPDDLLLSCFARVSRLYYPTLSLVSKSFRSLLVSTEFYKTRSSLGRTESCLYVCLRFGTDPNPCWFTLCRKPDQTLTNQKENSSGYVLAPIPIPHSLKAIGEHNLDSGWGGLSYCSIDNVRYCYTSLDGIQWYDSSLRYWIKLKGVKRLPKFAGYALVRLVDYGGKMVVFWDKYSPSSGYRSKTDEDIEHEPKTGPNLLIGWENDLKRAMTAWSKPKTRAGIERTSKRIKKGIKMFLLHNIHANMKIQALGRIELLPDPDETKESLFTLFTIEPGPTTS